MRVKMTPHLSLFKGEESGIRRVIEAYFKHLPEFGVELVDKDAESYDLSAIHAGTYTKFDKSIPLVAHTHGLYWTADYVSARWEHEANRNVIYTIRNAREVTVPSTWVREAFQRDMRFTPHVVPHGINWKAWKNNEENVGYVLWNKNRHADVCDPRAVGELAKRFHDVAFVTTFAPSGQGYPNVRAIGLQKHSAMKKIVQSCGVYLSSTKETFGIGVLEAMASGIPVLGFAHGGNLDLVEHGVNGYLAKAWDYDDLAEGLLYCLKYRKVLGGNGANMARSFDWRAAAEKVAAIYEIAVKPPLETVSIVIPSYMYADKVGRAIESAMHQDYPLLENIVVVDDGSPDYEETKKVVERFSAEDSRVVYLRQENQGVATARNTGIASVSSEYICCLDADDALDSQFISTCVAELKKDPSLGIAYTGLWYTKPNGEEGLSTWPGEFDFDAQLARRNQIPTACVFRRQAWERLGGYKKRYCVDLGAGSEDAEFWLRMGAYGYGAKKATDAGMFKYSWMSGRVSGNRKYREPDWLIMHPWSKDKKHPFASLATPENKLSHPVRQYDEPDVSVVVPVGEGHFNLLPDALDSLESQTFRKWEVIAVLDTEVEQDDLQRVKTAYPYARWVAREAGRSGAGAARNRGAEVARAPLLLFLDCDDMLFPEAIEKMVSAYRNTGNIVYTDYLGKAMMGSEDAHKLGDRLHSFDEKRGEAVVRYKSSDYDCELAQRQPDTARIYIWNLITSLIPIAWHRQIGGFDENMESWEDWDYWLRLARAGKCFTRIPEELVVYYFYTGTRRDRGVAINQHLLQYLNKKYQEEKIMMPCNCGSKNRTFTPTISVPSPQTLGGKMSAQTLSDDDFVLVEYTSQNRGSHKVVGAATRMFLGYHSGGDRFYIPRADFKAMSNLFREIGQVVDAPKDEVKVPTPPPVPVGTTAEPALATSTSFDSVSKFITETAAPAPVEFRPSLLAGVTPQIETYLIEAGMTTPEAIVAAGEETLVAIKGVGEIRAGAIIMSAKKYIEDRDVQEVDEDAQAD